MASWSTEAGFSFLFAVFSRGLGTEINIFQPCAVWPHCSCRSLFLPILMLHLSF